MVSLEETSSEASKDAEFIFKHVFFPPKVGNEADDDSRAETLLLQCDYVAADFVRNLATRDQQRMWPVITQSIKRWIKAYSSDGFDLESVTGQIKRMGQYETILLNVKSQNAAVLAYKDKAGITFHAFEISPKTEAVLETQDALLRTFPAKSVSISKDIVADQSFMEVLLDHLHKLAQEQTTMSRETITKAGAKISEDRQSENPQLVTQWLFALLAARGGQPTTNNSVSITKRCRDEVSWLDAEKPWRRSPMWLCIKVSLHLTMKHVFGEDANHIYKLFMMAFMCHVTKVITPWKTSLEDLHVIREKLARRNAKLGSDVLPATRKFFTATMERVKNSMQTTWSAISSVDKTEMPKLSTHQVDCEILLANSKDAMAKILVQHGDRKAAEQGAIEVHPSHSFSFDSSRLPDASAFHTAGNDKVRVLFACNQWVKSNLQTWTQLALPDERNCSALRNLISRYFESARTTFGLDQELMSISILTVLELWIALDRMVLVVVPLLRDFSPEIPYDIFSPLILSRSDDLFRLASIESYLKKRHDDQKPVNPSVFADPTHGCFGTQFYEGSADLQQLHERIKAHSDQEKSRVLSEYREKKSIYETKLKKAHEIPRCDKVTDRQGFRHSPFCQKCHLIRQANKLNIRKYEELLPEKIHVRKAVLFELQPPPQFVAWRDATYFLLQDIFRASPDVVSSKVKHTLADYWPLATFHKFPKRRVGLGSRYKAFNQSHYIRSEVSTTIEQELFVPHGLEHKYQDAQRKDLWVNNQVNNYSLSKYCRPKLPPGSYHVLLETLFSAHYSQNGIIARQADCPVSISTQEYVAFGSLRCGEHLQLLNVLRSFRAQEIDLNSTSVVVLLEHVLREVGDASGHDNNVLRVSHQQMRNVSFCEKLLDTVELHIKKIKSNWKELNSMKCCLIVAQRVASLTGTASAAILDQSIQIIRQIRQITLDWALQLVKNQKLLRARQTMSTSPDITETQRRVLDIILLTRATWNIDAQFRLLLLRDELDMTHFVTASIIMSDYKQLCSGTKDAALAKGLLQDHVTALENENLVRKLSLSIGSSISTGIQSIWEDLLVRDLWKPEGGSDSLWLTSETPGGNSVHWHVIDGVLLLAGRRISLLPGEYAQSPIYKQVLGENVVVDVVSSDLAWMDFMSTNLVEGNRLYFGKRRDEFIIQVVHNGTMFEAITRSLFVPDLPATIIGRTQPWLCLDDGHVELRDSDKQWSSEHKHWSITSSPSSRGMYLMRRGQDLLVDSNRPFGLTVCKMFQDFEHAKNLEIIYEDRSCLKVDLPRYHLNFMLHEDNFRCTELTAELDPDATTGCFHGLKTKLVLSSATASRHDKKRYILIPYGPVTITSAGHHVEAIVDTDEMSAVNFFQYKIDNNLGQIDADGHLESHLFKAYLHAVTSSCLNDTLTGRTGVEESLAALQDTITLTSVPMSRTANDILKAISKLTPIRTFYPDPNSKTLQTVKWHAELPFTSQHNSFSELATNIATHSVMANVLYECEKNAVPEYLGEQDLRQRALWRASRYYSAHLADSTDDLTLKDAPYRGRDHDYNKGQDVAYQVATVLFSWSASGPTEQNFYQILERYKCEHGFGSAFEFVGISGLLDTEMKVLLPTLMASSMAATKTNKDILAARLSLIVFGDPTLAPLARTLAAFAISEKLKLCGLPADLDYDLTLGRVVDADQITLILDTVCNLDQKDHLTYEQNLNDIDVEADLEVDLQIQRGLIRTAITQAWTSGMIELPDEALIPNFPRSALEETLKERLLVWGNNDSLYQKCANYARELEVIDKTHCLWSLPCLTVNHTSASNQRNHRSSILNLNQMPSMLEIFSKSDVSSLEDLRLLSTDYDKSLQPFFEADGFNSQVVDADAYALLKGLLVRLQQSHATGITEVGRELESSLRAYERISSQAKRISALPCEDFLHGMFDKVCEVVQAYLQFLRFVMTPSNEAQNGYQAAGFWPSPETRTMLQLLQSSEYKQLDESHQLILLDFARAVCAKQRLARMLHFLHAGDNFAFQREIENDAHGAWNIRDHPDWLLLEIQNDFLIRPTQVLVAEEIIQPRDGIVQLGMGEGKTSVILPMAITALSDGHRLVRVVILKSLANELLRSLSRSLSGLVARPLYHLPFSRSTPVSQQLLSTLSVIRDDCKSRKGAILCLPEHLNSFRLMGNDKVVTKEQRLQTRMLGAQKGFDSHAVDILDECDEILHPRNELVYTCNVPKPLSGAPNRWNVLLELLFLVETNVGNAQKTHPSSIDYTAASVNVYPRIRVLKDEGFDHLQSLILRDIEKGSISVLPLQLYDASIVDDAVRFIRDRDVANGVIVSLRKSLRSQAEIDCLYLLRGMFALGNLKAALERRWFVNYGLDRSRTLAAVPYRAKSTPALAAEFAFPDLMITFTALSYFYTGLAVEDLRLCIMLLLKRANPVQEYAKWIAAARVPDAYTSVYSLNAESDACIEQLHTSLKMNKNVISFFLRRVVFPRTAKEFPQKIVSSAWDLCAGKNDRFVSGFSGTCDVLMPLNMVKHKIANLGHYDAAVLMDLLKVSNRRYVCARGADGRVLDNGQLVALVSTEAIKSDVIIDAGAQLLERNVDVAKQWLALRHDSKMACVFFNDEDEKTVLLHDGTIEAWKTSPYREQVDKCLIFLDEFHTRGTDFHLPDHFTAAVLLGPRLDKDVLVQSCMRMRKLSFSQSLMFISTPEIDESIRTTLQLRADHNISTVDVIEWSIHQAFMAKEQQRSLWIDRGLSFLQRSQAFDKLVRPNGSITHREAYVRAILQDESYEVSRLYAGPNATSNVPKKCPYEVNISDPMAKKLLEHWEFGQTSNDLTCFQEQEQERETLHEVEQEREVERPGSMNPHKIRYNEELHKIIVSNSVVRVRPETVKSAFDILEHTTLRTGYSKNQWPAYLLATDDFLYPVKIADGSDLDDFLRPVTWLLVLRGLPHIILISCHEANAWMKDIEESTVATLIMYHPRLRMEAGSFDSLDFYQVSKMPSIAGIELKARVALRLFAGQLYFDDFKEYSEFCLLVGLWDGKMDLGVHQKKVDRSNYVPWTTRQVTASWMSKWRSNPVEMIKRFIGMRRLNDEWEHTHVGRVLNGHLLTEADFEWGQSGMEKK